jgi:uncharacterized membrane protein YfcA
MMLAIVVGTVLGTSLLTSGNTSLSTAALGAALALYAAYTLLARQLSVPAKLEPWLSPLIGLTTGFVTGGTGVFVIPAVPYLQALARGDTWCRSARHGFPGDRGIARRSDCRLHPPALAALHPLAP